MPIEFTRKGYYEVWRDGRYIDRHTSEREALETITVHHEQNGDGDYEIRPPLIMAKAYGVLSPGESDTEAPTEPGSLQASATSATTVSLTWTASTDNIGVTGYQVFRDGAPIDTTASLSYNDSGLSAGTQYSYEVAAFDAEGNNSTRAGPALVTTDSNSAPVWSLGDRSYDNGDGVSIDLDSVCTDADGDTITYSLESGALPTGLSLSGSRNETLSGTVTADGSYGFTLGASDGIAATQTVTLTFTVSTPDTTAPDAPDAPTVQSFGSSTITLSLPTSAASDHAGYIVQRSTDGTNYGDRAGTAASPITTSTWQDTGLNEQTTYYYRLRDVDDSQNVSDPGSSVSQTTAAIADNTNVSRISSILNGRSPTVSYSTPADPITTQTINVTAGNFSSLSSAVNTQGARVVVPAGTYVGNLTFAASDVDVEFDPNAEVVGNFQIGGGGGAASRISRLRITGGNQSGGQLSLFHSNDVMVDDFYFNTANGYNEMSGWSDGTDDGWNRVAFINTTIDHLGTSASGGWAWFTGGLNSGPTTNLILMNFRMLTDGSQNNRFQSVNTMIVVDASFNDDFGSANGMRTGDGGGGNGPCSDLWYDNVVVNEGWLMNYNGIQNVSNGIFNRVYRYHDGSFFNFADMVGSNTGTISNSGGFGSTGTPPGSLSVSPFTDGGGNTVGNHSFLGTGVPTLPDGTSISSIGAVR